MNRGARMFLRVVLVLVGLGALAFLLWEPHTEGRNAHATLFEIYFKDPFLAYAYIGSIPFFVGLWQAFKLLGFDGRHKLFSPSAVRSLRIIKFCAIALVGFVAVGEVFIFMHTEEDRAGGVFMGVLITFASIVVATTMAVLERVAQTAVDLKSENDLTV
jgi:hypothetical protein